MNAEKPLDHTLELRYVSVVDCQIGHSAAGTFKALLTAGRASVFPSPAEPLASRLP